MLVPGASKHAFFCSTIVGFFSLFSKLALAIVCMEVIFPQGETDINWYGFAGNTYICAIAATAICNDQMNENTFMNLKIKNLSSQAMAIFHYLAEIRKNKGLQVNFNKFHHIYEFIDINLE